MEPRPPLKELPSLRVSSPFPPSLSLAPRPLGPGMMAAHSYLQERAEKASWRGTGHGPGAPDHPQADGGLLRSRPSCLLSLARVAPMGFLL